ncbi:hypothetical protein [Paenibacillus polysaccharolyticus]|uniref:hypothetical protein n=1 Tax=Paenibacillus polysaccharolyticus TaxID=582692 RepID=UPI0012B98A6A|nr:hypothetical protein [Paenibacillus polysaccharolyticus]
MKFGDKGERFASFRHFRSLRYDFAPRAALLETAIHSCWINVIFCGSLLMLGFLEMNEGAQSWMFGCSGRRSSRGMPFGSLLSPNFFDQPFTELKFGDKGERFASFGHFHSLRY